MKNKKMRRLSIAEFIWRFGIIVFMLLTCNISLALSLWGGFLIIDILILPVTGFLAWIITLW